MRKKTSAYLFLLLLCLLSDVVKAAENQTLWYKTPATGWSTAFPLGNGKMGAMVYGNPLQDRIVLSERSDSPSLNDVRRGELNLIFSTHKNYKNYKRTLDLNAAVASTEYTTADGVVCRREYMTSFLDSVVVIRLTMGKKGALSCNLTLKTPFNRSKVLDGQAMLLLTGETDEVDAKGNRFRFITLVKPWVTEGVCGLQNGVYTIRKADEAVIYAASLSVPSTDKRSDNELVESCYRKLARAFGKDYPTMRKKHVSLYQELYNRVSLDLDQTAQADKPTDQRLKEQVMLPDPSLSMLYFNFCRYLLISNSRNTSRFPASYGLWSERAITRSEPKVRSDWYLTLEPLGLSALNEPLFASTRSKADAESFIKPGPTQLPGGGGSLLSDYLWNHYLFTGDKQFLSEHFLFMQSAARFYMDTLAVSPMGGRQDIQDLFTGVMAATDVLHTGIKGRLSPEKAFADSLKKRMVPVPAVHADLPSGQWINKRKVAFSVDPSSRLEENITFPTKVVDLLLQSGDGYIFVLPALPPAWKGGAVKGVLARGGFEVSLSWKNGRLASLSIRSALGGPCRIRSAVPLQGLGVKPAKGDVKNPLLGVKTNGGDDVGTNPQLFDLLTEPGKTYLLTAK